jgi:hypothetical protein
MYAHMTDIYVRGLVLLNRGELDLAREELAKMHGDMGGVGAMATMDGMAMASGKRIDVAPHLLRLALEGQIELAAGNSEIAIVLIQKAEEIEAAMPSEYGPAVPVQPMAELLADAYRETGNYEMARNYYEISLERAVGRVRSIQGLSKLP